MCTTLLSYAYCAVGVCVYMCVRVYIYNRIGKNNIKKTNNCGLPDGMTQYFSCQLGPVHIN